MARRKICVVTGGRAEYGLLSWLMHEIADDDSLTLQLVATGAHLSPGFGESWRQIEADGFTIDERVVLDLDDDSPVSIARAMGQALAGIAEVLGRLNPDIVVLLGDRYEILAAAEAALLLRIPVAHIHGGELTEGALDDAMRHAITKLAHIHFVACEEYGRRVCQLGEDPAQVHVVGALGVDAVRMAEPLSREELEESLGIRLVDPILLTTYHPATLGDRTPAAAVDTLLEALDRIMPATVIFTGVNADPGNRAVSERIRRWVDSHPANALWCDQLGQRRYISLLALSSVVIGNSSSGIIEAPVFGTPTVNLGDRQGGRIHGQSVIDCAESTTDIVAAIRKAFDPEFRAAAREAPYPFGSPGTAGRIVEILKTVELDSIVYKKFFDLPV